jgi:LysM repeat protein
VSYNIRSQNDAKNHKIWHIYWYLYDSINNLKQLTIMVRAKYQDVLDLGESLKIQNGNVSEENGVLKVDGTAATQYEKNLIWDKIKEVGGDNPADITANIKVADESVYARHTVSSGETLGKIAKHYYGDAMKYKDIFAANSDILKNPDMIHPDQ